MDRNGLTEEQQDTIIVALRKESVDRNMCSGCSGSLRWVALRKESVDRNTLTVRNCSGADLVALRKESVDRNHTNVLPSVEVKPSLSARRAWIEIRKSAVQEKYRCVALRKESVDRNRWGDYSTGAATVALRKESVDRNFSFSFIAASRFSSLSARRAWIEMSVTGNWLTAYRVALRKESVECFSF